MQDVKGTITTSSLAGLKQLNLDNYQVKLFIVRYQGEVMKSLTGMGFVHVPQLSPSSDLFQLAQKWKKQAPTEWFLKYELCFEEEMKKMIPYINRIREHLDSGKNVLLVCYCSDVSECHRGILGGTLFNMGYPASIK